jgi:NADH dehydrogenase
MRQFAAPRPERDRCPALHPQGDAHFEPFESSWHRRMMNKKTEAPSLRVVIVGAGFAGLACARALGSTGARVTIVDRHNYHLFVPLLYQVATAALSPADIAEPIRKILRRHRNVDVLLGEVAGVDTANRSVCLADGERLDYDRLVLAPGSRYNYFAHPEWEAWAPGLKTIADARRLRSRLLCAFELAERERDPQRQRALLTTVIVGGGPTGVEMAGAIAELARHALVRDFRHVDPAAARVMLVEAGPRILAAFPEALAAFAHRRLERLGVEISCGAAVEQIGPHSVRIGGDEVAAGAVIWGAGIRAGCVGDWLGVPVDRAGRVRVDATLAVPDFADIFVLGDSARFDDPGTGNALPALAQVAHQQGQHLGRALRRQLSSEEPLPPFRFRDRGNTAIVGRNAAIFDFGRWQLKGRLAWLLWAIVHIYLLVGFEKRLLVAIQWLWRYLTYQRGARLITGGDDAAR